MTGGWKPRHVDADLGDDHAGGRVAEPRHRGQEADGGAKGPEGVSEMGFEVDHRGFERFDLGEMQLHHVTVMRCDPAV